MSKSRRPPKARSPSGEEKKNQLDLFRDWTAELGRRSAAAAAAAAEAAAKHFEELRAVFDQRSAKFCGILVTALAACAYKELYNLPTLILAFAVALSVLLTAVPLFVCKTPRSLRVSGHLATLTLIVGVLSFAATMLGHWLPVGSVRGDVPRQATKPESDPPLAPAIPDEKSLTENVQKQSAEQTEKEAAWAADCISKENAVTAARRRFRWREKEFTKCKTEHANAFTIKSLLQGRTQ